MPLPQAWSSLEVRPGPTGNKPSQQQKVEAEPRSVGPTGLCPWSEAKGSHPRPSAPAPPSSHTALTHCQPHSHVDPRHFLPVQGSLRGGQKRHLCCSKAAWLDVRPHCPPQPGAYCLGGPGLSGTILPSLPLPASLSLEGPGSGVSLGPPPWSWSLRVGADGQAPSGQGHWIPRTQASPWEGRTKAITASQDGPAREDISLHLVPRKAPLFKWAGWDPGGRDVPAPAGSCPGSQSWQMGRTWASCGHIQTTACQDHPAPPRDASM